MPFHINFLQKTVDAYCIVNNIQTIFGHFGHFDKFSGHPRVIFANARSSLKFWVSYLARFIVNFQSVSRLFPRVFLIYSQSRKP